MPWRLLILVTLALATVAHAQPADSPWSRGVSDERKARAKVLLEAGNRLLLESKAKEAAASYEQALVAWDHPAIRFNLVRALIALDKPLEAFENLERALAYGAAPLEDQVYGEALNYQRLLAGQIGTIALRCDQPGVVLTLDRETALTCPGVRELRVLPGKHVLVGSAQGLLTESRELFVIGGETTRTSMTLVSLGQAGRRWPRWQPWTIAGTGIALVGVGIAFNVLARTARDEHEQQTALHCAARGCEPAEYAERGLARLEDQVETRNVVSLVALGVGGATALTGGVMVLLNRSLARASERVGVIRPGGGLGVAVRLRF